MTVAGFIDSLSIPTLAVGMHLLQKGCIELRISTKGRYALKAIVIMAIKTSKVDNEKSFMSIREIAKEAELSEGYLEQLFILLKRHKIVNSIKGTKGGYTLNKPSDQITAKDVLLATEGSLAPVNCLKDETETCTRREFCITRSVWIKMSNEINKYVGYVPIEQITKHYDGLAQNAVWDYVI